MRPAVALDLDQAGRDALVQPVLRRAVILARPEAVDERLAPGRNDAPGFIVRESGQGVDDQDGVVGLERGQDKRRI